MPRKPTGRPVGRPRTRYLKEPQFCVADEERCGNPVKHQPTSLCNKHYIRFRRYGDPMGGGSQKSRPRTLVHGTITGYTDFLCGCDDCTRANREACQRAARAREQREESSCP